MKNLNLRTRRTAPIGRRSRPLVLAVGLSSILGLGVTTAYAQTGAPAPDPAKPALTIQPPQTPVDVGVAGKPDSVSLADMQQAAASEGVSLEDVRLSMTQSKVLVDSILRLRSDLTFGDIWVTYNPYKVHLRLSRENPAIVADLTKSLGYPFETTIRGLSNSAMDAL